MRQTRIDRRVGAQFRVAYSSAIAFGLVLLVFLGLPAARAQSPIGTAEACFEAGPDHVPAFTATPVPPVRPGLPAEFRTHWRVTGPVTAKLEPAGYTPLKAMPVHMLNIGSKDRWTPELRKSPELLASAR